MKHIENSDADARLWEAIVAHEGEIFVTARGLEYRYSVKHNRDGAVSGEIVFDRKTKSITRATIFLACQKALEIQAAEGCVKGPKKLGVFGASYLYPIFLKLGIYKGPYDGPRKAADRAVFCLRSAVDRDGIRRSGFHSIIEGGDCRVDD